MFGHLMHFTYRYPKQGHGGLLGTGHVHHCQPENSPGVLSPPSVSLLSVSLSGLDEFKENVVCQEPWFYFQTYELQV